MPRWATIKEAADYMRIKPGTIYNAVSQETELGRLFKKATGCNPVADLDEVDEYLRSGKK